MKQISFRDVNINGGFWADRQRVNAEKTIYNVRDRFAETGRFDAFKLDWKEGMENKPHYFWDSDVAKWIESAAYIIQKSPDKELEKNIDEVVDLLEKGQEENGYFNIYFTVVEPEHRFFNRDWHELYCAGHMTEAAVAYYYATGKRKLLDCMIKYLDYIDKVFRIEDSAPFHTPGHEEIELALVKLYHCTGDEKWLNLSKHFIDRRGQQQEVPEDHWCIDKYYQSHQPCRDQHTAEGHSVRACYLYTGMADVAGECGDEALKEACFDIFDDIYYKKIYITGGIGQSNAGEAFTVPYDLPNSRAYTETCAAIALCYFTNRLQNLKVDSRYADVAETAMYNGVLSGVSIDGGAFFYKNPLEFLHAERDRNVSVPKDREPFPEAARQRVFWCSCCPPNVTRFIASIGDYIYGEDDGTIYIHQFVPSDVKIDGAEISVKTAYPTDGTVNISVKGAKGKKIAIRIPAYTEEKYSVLCSGKDCGRKSENGYLYVSVDGDAEITLNVDVSPKLVYANPLVNEDAGKACVIAGPLVYCAESVDNGENLRAIYIDSAEKAVRVTNNEIGTTDIEMPAERLTQKAFNGLYSFSRSFEPCTLHLIPFYAMVNRGECDMTVWLNCR